MSKVKNQQIEAEEFQESDPVDDLMTAAIEWCMSKKPDWFDDSFIESLYNQYQERGSLSPRQIAALENIATKFGF